MKLDFSKVLLDFKGESVKTDKGENTTLAYATTEALLAVTRNELDLSGTEKAARYRLAEKVHASLTDKEVSFSVEEVNKIKELIGNCWSAIMVGSAWKELDVQVG